VRRSVEHEAKMAGPIAAADKLHFIDLQLPVPFYLLALLLRNSGVSLLSHRYSPAGHIIVANDILSDAAEIS
jgi:hypothetical protein